MVASKIKLLDERCNVIAKYIVSKHLQENAKNYIDHVNPLEIQIQKLR